MTHAHDGARVLADWNRLDSEGRIRLGVVAHAATDFVALVGAHLLFVDGNEVVEGRLAVGDDGEWLGLVDWATQRPAVGDEDEMSGDRAAVW